MASLKGQALDSSGKLLAEGVVDSMARLSGGPWECYKTATARIPWTATPRSVLTFKVLNTNEEDELQSWSFHGIARGRVFLYLFWGQLPKGPLNLKNNTDKMGKSKG